MPLRRIAATLIALLTLPGAARAQEGLLAFWNRQVDEALSTQPHFVTPLATASADLTERYRSDFTREIMPGGTTTWDYGSGKGFDVIPWHKLEVDIVPPPYLQHNSPLAADGFGDFSTMAKYRIAAGDAQHGAYAVSASLGGAFPTGSFENGSPRGAVIPTIYAGKGFGNFNVQSSLGVSLPTGDADALGRPVAWNVAGQYRMEGVLHQVAFWPEIESNATFYHGGPNDGRRQNFVTVGMIMTGFPMGFPAPTRMKMSFGAGIQIATTHFHTCNHALILSSRVNF